MDITIDYDSDGIIVIHTPTDGTPAYAIGPFPPIKEIAEQVIAGARCDCAKAVMSIDFPKGVKMMLNPGPVTEAMGNLGIVVAITEGEDEPEGPVH